MMKNWSGLSLRTTYSTSRSWGIPSSLSATRNASSQFLTSHFTLNIYLSSISKGMMTYSIRNVLVILLINYKL